MLCSFPKVGPQLVQGQSGCKPSLDTLDKTVSPFWGRPYTQTSVTPGVSLLARRAVPPASPDSQDAGLLGHR